MLKTARGPDADAVSALRWRLALKYAHDVKGGAPPLDQRSHPRLGRNGV